MVRYFNKNIFTALYAVFAFQKMETIWNNEGKAEYVELKEKK